MNRARFTCQLKKHNRPKIQKIWKPLRLYGTPPFSDKLIIEMNIKIKHNFIYFAPPPLLNCYLHQNDNAILD